MMARDPGLLTSIKSHLSDGHGPAHALWAAFEDGVKGTLIETISNLAEGSLNLSQVCLCASAGVADRLDERSLHADPSALAVLQATAMMARDPGLLTSVKSHLSDGHGPAHALWAAFEDFCAQALG
jgi:phosphotransferase system enzyme I (PtsI)